MVAKTSNIAYLKLDQHLLVERLEELLELAKNGTLKGAAIVAFGVNVNDPDDEIITTAWAKNDKEGADVMSMLSALEILKMRMMLYHLDIPEFDNKVIDIVDGPE